MKKRGVIVLVILLVSLISISLVSAIYVSNKITGRVTGENVSSNETEAEPEEECVDSDGGENYYIKGEVTKGAETKIDRCDLCTGACLPDMPDCPVHCGGLIEYYCDGDNIVETAHVCPNYCEDGVCLREVCPTIIGWRIENGRCVSDTGCDYDPSEYTYYDTEEICTNQLGEEPVPPEPEPEPEPDEPPYEVETCAASIKITLDKDIYYYGNYAKLRVEIVDAEGNGLANYPFRSRIFTYGDGLWHTGESSETGEDGLFIRNDRIERGKQPPGKIRLKVTTSPNIEGCGPVEDTMELEIREGEDTEEVCGIGTCIPEEDEEVEDIPEDRGLYACSGCELEGKCYPMGYRKAGQYCSEDYEFIEQLDEAVCDNSFECKSNMCVSGECVGEGLMRKIINWFKKMFGGEDEDDKKPGEEICKKLLIEKDIRDYEYEESFYGNSKETQVPVYSEDGEQIDIVKCCAASYLCPGEAGCMGLVCPFDNREDVKNSLKWLLIKNTNLVLSEYKGENVLKDSNRAIAWTSNAYIVASGGDPSRGSPLAEEIVDAYLKKYKNDLEDIEIPPRPPPEHHDPTEEFLRDIEGLGTLILIDFETLPDGTILQNKDRLTGKEWETIGVVFEFPSEDYLQVFGPLYPFNPLDKLSLSPGLGPFEAGGDTHDDLTIIFSEPVKAAGIYLLDLGETDERESITFLDESNNIIKKISPWPRSTFGNPAPGTFVSLVHDGISKIEILENAEDGDDVAYDNLYFVR